MSEGRASHATRHTSRSSRGVTAGVSGGLVLSALAWLAPKDRTSEGCPAPPRARPLVPFTLVLILAAATATTTATATALAS